MHQADLVDAESLVKMIETILLSLGLDFKLLRGQTYDGASTLQGAHSGVAVRIREKNNKARSLHCCNHSLNLVCQEGAKKCSMIQQTFSVVQSVCNVIRASPKRLALFNGIKVQSGFDDAGGSRDGISGNIGALRPLCPTRWTCRTSSITSIMDNYGVIVDTLEEIARGGGNSEGAKAAPGLMILMEKFSTVLGMFVCHRVFAPIEEMAKSLQSKDITASAVRTLCNGLLRYLKDMRTNEYFKNIYDSAISMCIKLKLGQPELPRQRKTTKRIGDFYRNGAETDTEWTSPETFYRAQYFSVLDLISRQIESRFNQDTLNFLCTIEDILLRVANGEQCDDLFTDDFVNEIKDDVNVKGLKNEFATLKSFINETFPQIKSITTIDTIIDIFKTNKFKTMMSETRTLLQLYLTIPMSNATAERSFSALRRVKNYLRSRLTQQHLNHHLMLYVHKSLTDSIEIEHITRTFISVTGERQKFFGKYPRQ